MYHTNIVLIAVQTQNELKSGYKLYVFYEDSVCGCSVMLCCILLCAFCVCIYIDDVLVDGKTSIPFGMVYMSCN